MSIKRKRTFSPGTAGYQHLSPSLLAAAQAVTDWSVAQEMAQEIIETSDPVLVPPQPHGALCKTGALVPA